MNIDNFISSELKIVASQNINIQDDLNTTQDKSINTLINEENNKNTNEKKVSEKTEK